VASPVPGVRRYDDDSWRKSVVLGYVNTMPGSTPPDSRSGALPDMPQRHSSFPSTALSVAATDMAARVVLAEATETSAVVSPLTTPYRRYSTAFPMLCASLPTRRQMFLSASLLRAVVVGCRLHGAPQPDAHFFCDHQGLSE